jgi:hypothetical protein
VLDRGWARDSCLASFKPQGPDLRNRPLPALHGQQQSTSAQPHAGRRDGPHGHPARAAGGVPAARGDAIGALQRRAVEVGGAPHRAVAGGAGRGRTQPPSHTAGAGTGLLLRRHAQGQHAACVRTMQQRRRCATPTLRARACVHVHARVCHTCRLQSARATYYGTDDWSIHKGSCGYGAIWKDEPHGCVCALPARCPVSRTAPHAGQAPRMAGVPPPPPPARAHAAATHRPLTHVVRCRWDVAALTDYHPDYATSCGCVCWSAGALLQRACACRPGAVSNVPKP